MKKILLWALAIIMWLSVFAYVIYGFETDSGMGMGMGMGQDTGPAAGYGLLLEAGNYLLLENGSYILLE